MGGGAAGARPGESGGAVGGGGMRVESLVLAEALTYEGGNFHCPALLWVLDCHIHMCQHYGVFKLTRI